MTEMKPSWNPWPWAIILSFVVFIGGTVGLVVMACAQKSDLVSPKYYEQELKFQTQLDRVNRAARLGAGVSIVYDPARQLITISVPANHSHRELSGKIEFYRPSAAGLDRHFPLMVDAGGKQSFAAGGLQPGLWQIRVSWTVDGQDYAMEQKLVITRRR